MARIVIPQKTQDDVRIQVNARAHLPVFLPACPIALRALAFSSGSRGLPSAALPKSDIKLGVGDTRAVPSGLASQTTWEVFQRFLKIEGIVVCPLLDI